MGPLAASLKALFTSSANVFFSTCVRETEREREKEQKCYHDAGVIPMCARQDPQAADFATDSYTQWLNCSFIPVVHKAPPAECSMQPAHVSESAGTQRCCLLSTCKLDTLSWAAGTSTSRHNPPQSHISIPQTPRTMRASLGTPLRDVAL